MSHAVYRYRYTIVPLHVTGSGNCLLRNKHSAVTVLPHASINYGGVPGSTAWNGQDTVTGPTFAGTFNKVSALTDCIGLCPDLGDAQGNHSIPIPIECGDVPRNGDLEEYLYGDLQRRLY